MSFILCYPAERPLMAEDGLVCLRPFQPHDQTAVQHLINSGLGEHFGFVDPRLNPDLVDIWQTYGQAGHYFIVAEQAGEIVGTGCLRHETAVTGQLVRMSVKHSHRRQGIGRQIVAHLLSHAHRMGYQTILVETNHDWTAAIQLYQTHGFQEYTRDDESIYMQLAIKN